MKLLAKFLNIFRQASPGFRKRLVGVLLLLVVFNIAVWMFTFLASGANPTLLGLVVLAYGLGLRHAVDADHIAIIDNTTRKLMNEGQHPVAVGFFFSLGHSSVVIPLSLFLAISASLVSTLPQLKATGALVGTLVSSFFLIMIGLINLVALIDIFKMWRKVIHQGRYSQEEIHEHLQTKGALARLVRPFLKTVSGSWNLFPVGLLFGLGFDTASEVGLLSVSAATGASRFPLWLTLLLPLAFTAGMSLVDSLDGILMLGAYGWAYINPVRKLYYNLNITFISVVIALFIGGVEALQLIIGQLNLRGNLFTFIKNLDFSNLGYIIILTFVASWFISATIYKLKGYDFIESE